MEEYFYDLEIGRPPKVLMKKEMTDKLDYTKSNHKNHERKSFHKSDIKFKTSVFQKIPQRE